MRRTDADRALPPPVVPLAACALVLALASTGCGTGSGAEPAGRVEAAPESSVPNRPVRPDRLFDGTPFPTSSPTTFVPYGSPSPRASVPPPVSGPCPEGGVRVVADRVNAAMGLRAMDVQLVNCGDGPRTLNGYPEVRVLDERRRRMDVAVHDGLTVISAGGVDDSAPRTVTLRPGETARATVMWRNTHDLGRSGLHGTHLEVAPAAGDPRQTVTPDGGVDLGSTGKLGVGPWRSVD